MDKVSHAYILNGPDKSGKMMIAEAFAQTLQDVYKRQLLIRVSRVRTPGGALRSTDFIADGYGAVSYTHLDVYKRQGV